MKIYFCKFIIYKYIDKNQREGLACLNLAREIANLPPRAVILLLHETYGTIIIKITYKRK